MTREEEESIRMKRSGTRKETQQSTCRRHIGFAECLFVFCYYIYTLLLVYTPVD